MRTANMQFAHLSIDEARRYLRRAGHDAESWGDRVAVKRIVTMQYTTPAERAQAQADKIRVLERHPEFWRLFNYAGPDDRAPGRDAGRGPPT